MCLPRCVFILGPFPLLQKQPVIGQSETGRPGKWSKPGPGPEGPVPCETGGRVVDSTSFSDDDPSLLQTVFLSREVPRMAFEGV